MRKRGRSAGRNGSDFGRILIRRSVGHFKPNPAVRFLGPQQPRFGRFRLRKPKPIRGVVLGPNPPKGGLILPDWRNGQALAKFFRKFAKMRNFAKSGEKNSHFCKCENPFPKVTKTRVLAPFQKRLRPRGFANRKKLKSSAE